MRLFRRDDVRRGVIGTRARDFSWVWREISFFSRGGIRWVSFSWTSAMGRRRCLRWVEIGCREAACLGSRYKDGSGLRI